MTDQLRLVPRNCENHSQCQLKIKCCVCRDMRYKVKYTEYVDGEGIVNHSHRSRDYCPGCKIVFSKRDNYIQSTPDEYHQLKFTKYQSPDRIDFNFQRQIYLPVYEHKTYTEKVNYRRCCSIQ